MKDFTTMTLQELKQYRSFELKKRKATNLTNNDIHIKGMLQRRYSVINEVNLEINKRKLNKQ